MMTALTYACLFAMALYGFGWILQIILRRACLRRQRREEWLRFRWGGMFEEPPSEHAAPPTEGRDSAGGGRGAEGAELEDAVWQVGGCGAGEHDTSP